MSAIEGIPEGYELARIGAPKQNEPYLTPRGRIDIAEGNFDGCGYAVLRKIEKPKQYRPFANGDEFLSHPLNGEWIRLSSISFTKVSQFDDARFWASNEEQCYTWEEGFNLLKFRNGSPFGIEVTE